MHPRDTTSPRHGPRPHGRGDRPAGDGAEPGPHPTPRAGPVAVGERELPGLVAREPRGPATGASVLRPRLGTAAHLRATLLGVADALTATPATPHLPDDDRAAQPVQAARAQLRASVTALVRRLRADGVAEPHAVRHVEAAVRETLVARPPGTAGTLADDVVRWSVEAYQAA